MSLHTLANHLQSAGRGQDSVLVHMTPGEVKGLQSLAMSQGGSLTINPETGLPEAGILSALLPIAAGFFLGPAGLQLTAMQSALAVGAIGTAATGSLGKGLMMGFGAYGGAGLGGGLMNAGAAAGTAGANAGTTAAGFADDVVLGAADDVAAAKLGDATTKAATNSSYTGARTAADTTGNAVTNSGGLQAYQPASPFANTPQGINAGNYQLPNGTYAAPPPPQITYAASSHPFDYTSKLAKIQNDPLMEAQIGAKATISPPSKMDQLGAGFRDVTSSGTKAWNFVKEHPSPFIGVGVGALQEMQERQAKDAAAAAKSGSPGMIRPYELSVAQNEAAYAPSASTAERRFFEEPRYRELTPYAAKEGGLMGLNNYAVGGPVEEMSAANAVGGNMMYPQSQLQTPVYSNPMMARPMPTNVVNVGGDAPVDRYTGEQRFAFGGSATAKAKEPTTDTKYSFDPATQQFTQTTTSTPATNTGLGLRGMGVGAGLGGMGVGAGLDGKFTGFSKGFGGLGGATMNPAFAALYGNQQAAPQPAVTTETSGGFKTQPYVPPNQAAAADTSMIPNIQIPQQQSVNQQLGLEAFYPMMEQQLALKGSQLQSQNMADGGMASGGYNLGGYSDGGRLLRGPGDGVSDSIPASIGNRQPARLADGEFVVPARIVSEIGNGSTEAGARKLYAMMDRVQKARRKTVGKNKVAVNTKADKLLPA